MQNIGGFQAAPESERRIMHVTPPPRPSELPPSPAETVRPTGNRKPDCLSILKGSGLLIVTWIIQGTWLQVM